MFEARRAIIDFAKEKADLEPVFRRIFLYRQLAEFCGDPQQAADLLALATELELADHRCREFAFKFTQRRRGRCEVSWAVDQGGGGTGRSVETISPAASNAQNATEPTVAGSLESISLNKPQAQNASSTQSDTLMATHAQNSPLSGWVWGEVAFWSVLAFGSLFWALFRLASHAFHQGRNEVASNGITTAATTVRDVESSTLFMICLLGCLMLRIRRLELHSNFQPRRAAAAAGTTQGEK